MIYVIRMKTKWYTIWFYKIVNYYCIHSMYNRKKLSSFNGRREPAIIFYCRSSQIFSIRQICCVLKGAMNVIYAIRRIYPGIYCDSSQYISFLLKTWRWHQCREILQISTLYITITQGKEETVTNQPAVYTL